MITIYKYKCKYCKEKFESEIWLVYYKRFCCKDCEEYYNNEHLERQINYKGIPMNICQRCGKSFHKYNWYKNKYCSSECRYPRSKCIDCGKEISKNAKRCSYCSKKINSNTLCKDEFLAKKYNISKEELSNMITLQNNKCKICRRDFKECKRVIDHDHKTGKVRGLLCNRCNMFLGWVENNIISIEALNNMIIYLKSFNTNI
jgi:hypothetical protein